MTIAVILVALSFIDAPTRDSHPVADMERIVVDDRFPGGYQVELADVDGDRKLDIVALGNGTCAWFRNPDWKKRIVSGPDRSPGIISTAAADIDGDGRAEIAIAYEFAMNQPRKGKLMLAKTDDPIAGTWSFREIAEIGSIHRLRWGDVDGDRRLDLVVAPIFGVDASPPEFDQAPAILRVYRNGLGTEPEVVSKHLIMHAIGVVDLEGDGRSEVLTASMDGATRLDLDASTGRFRSTRISAGADASAGRRAGASEIHVGRFRDGRRFVATIDPWHGSEVSIRELGPDALPDPSRPGERVVLDTTLDDGHALCVADGDGDGDDEVFAGHRGKDHRVSRYDVEGRKWTRTVIDPAVAAQDLRAADLDGDGRPEVVAIGGKTANIVIYRFPARSNRDSK
ncbi:MAG: VCBS repeat-containing protein [Isosphaeraceae bacterium]|nr:VCBS repeat-containing protein [Isosphaeraceae bacterium]